MSNTHAKTIVLPVPVQYRTHVADLTMVEQPNRDPFATYMSKIRTVPYKEY